MGKSNKKAGGGGETKRRWARMSAKPRRMDARSEDPVSRCSSAPPVSWQALWRLLAHMRHSVIVDPTGSFFKDISLCWLHRVGSWCKILKQQKSTWAHGFFGPPRSRTVAPAGLLRTFFLAKGYSASGSAADPPHRPALRVSVAGADSAGRSVRCGPCCAAGSEKEPQVRAGEVAGFG